MRKKKTCERACSIGVLKQYSLMCVCHCALSLPAKPSFLPSFLPSFFFIYIHRRKKRRKKEKEEEREGGGGATSAKLHRCRYPVVYYKSFFSNNVLPRGSFSIPCLFLFFFNNIYLISQTHDLQNYK